MLRFKAAISGVCLAVLLLKSAVGCAIGEPINAAAGQSINVIVLKYADISEIVGILIGGETITPNDVFTPTGSIFSLPSSNASSGTGVATTNNQPFNSSTGVPQVLAQRINETIAVDRRLNAVILTGTPSELARLKSLIAKLDVPVPSVLFECQVFELSETAARDAGIELNSGSLASGGFQSLSGQAGKSSGTLQAQLYAQIIRGAARVLAAPRILAQNGNQASILSGNALPILTTTIFPGSSLSQQTVNYIAVGVNLQIQPRVSADGNVTSHIYSEVSSVSQFVSTAQGDVPLITLRQTTTSATVPDGQLFIIGGLSRETQIRNVARIPILGYLPLIGTVFRVRHDTTERVNLYIAITPHVVPAASAGETSKTPWPKIAYRGRWEFPHNRLDGRFEGASARSFHIGDTLSARFEGKKLHIYGVTGPKGGYGLLRVDGTHNVLNFYSAVKRTHALLYANSTLSAGVHNVAISVAPSYDLRSSGRYVNIDEVETGA